MMGPVTQAMQSTGAQTQRRAEARQITVNTIPGISQNIWGRYRLMAENHHRSGPNLFRSVSAAMTSTYALMLMTRGRGVLGAMGCCLEGPGDFAVNLTPDTGRECVDEFRTELLLALVKQISAHQGNFQVLCRPPAETGV